MSKIESDGRMADGAIPEIFIPKKLRSFQPLNLYNFDEALYWGCRLILKPGMVVFDIGTYCGVLTTMLSFLVGRKGRLVLFDQSKAPIERARNLALSNTVMNIEYVQANISDHEEQSENTQPATISLNGFIDRSGLVPQLIKIDTGKTLLPVIKGLLKHQAVQKPVLMIKIDAGGRHGEELYQLLDENGYSMLDLERSALVKSGDLVDLSFSTYLLCLADVEDNTLMEKIPFGSGRIRTQREDITQLNQARDLVNGDEHQQALKLLEPLLKTHPFDAEINYLSALCLSKDLQQTDRALMCFQRALDHGFDAGWVFYQRGILNKNMGFLEKAFDDLKKAAGLHSEKQVVNNLLDMVEKELFYQKLEQTRQFVKDGSFLEAKKILDDCLQSDPQQAEANYLSGFCEQMTDGEEERILDYYQAALDGGYDEYWVRYNRSALFLKVGDVDAALADIMMARSIRPDEPDVSKRLSEIIETVYQKNRSNINKTWLYVPADYKDILPVSPCQMCFDYEPLAYLAIQAVMKPDSIFLDVGSSYGVLSVLAASIDGFHGQVYAFEANPEVVKKAEMLAAANDLQEKIQIFPYCVGETKAERVDFYQIAGFDSVASTRNPNIKEEYQNAERISVKMVGLDSFCDELDIIPDVIKVDVEGSEYLVLEGAKRLLVEHQPDLIVETHWERIYEIGGSLEALCRQLEEYGYEIFDLRNAQKVNAAEYCRRYQASIGYLLATMKKDDFPSEAEFSHWLNSEMKLVEKNRAVWASYEKARKLVASDDFQESIQLLKSFLQQAADYAEAHYLLAYCLDRGDVDRVSALEHYQLALQNGFDEFWVCYHRGALLFEMGKYEDACSDLKIAARIKPTHRETKRLYQGASEALARDRLSKARSAINKGNYQQAINILSLCLDDETSKAEAGYLLAFSYQQIREKSRDALVYYQMALEEGYNPFWVYYQRAQLYANQGDFVASMADIQRALELDESNAGARQVHREISFHLGVSNV